MNRTIRATLMSAVAALAACGDPVMIVGDWPGTLRIVAGVPEQHGSTVDTVATRAELYEPRGLAADERGVVYIADHVNSRIVSVASNGRFRVVADRTGCSPLPVVQCLNRPYGLALDAAGNVIIADPAAHSVWSANPVTGRLQRIAGTGTRGGAPDGTPARGAALAQPSGVAVGQDGRIFVAETDSNRVRVIGADGVLRTVAGSGARGFSGDGGPATSARLSAPVGLAVSGSQLFIADRDNQRVRAVDLSTGIIRSVAGAGVPAFAGDGGPAVDAALRYPVDVAVTPDGRVLFVADEQNHRIRSVDLATGGIATFAGTGSDEYVGNGGSAGATGLRLPAGVTVSPHNLLYISDTGHHIVWRAPVGF